MCVVTLIIPRDSKMEIGIRCIEAVIDCEVSECEGNLIPLRRELHHADT